MNTAIEYRKRHTTTVTIDGLDWLLRAVSPDLLVGNLNLLPTQEKVAQMQTNVQNDGDKTANLTPEMQDNLEQTMQALDVFLPAGIVSPKVVAKEEDVKDEETLWIKEITLPDRLALFSKIMEVSGFSDEAEATRKKLENPPSPLASAT